MPIVNKEIDNLAINTIRFLAVDAVQKANSGHPGMPMGCAPIAYALYKHFMNHNPENPKWYNRDRFILSAGHGSMLLYGILHLCGYKISMYDLKQFRQWGSITPGHPEFNMTPGVETSTGPLGQGLSNAVGMGIAQKHLAAIFNKDDIKLIDHYIYGICSDGDLMEGVTHETCALAGHLKLGSLIFFYDDNGITIDGSTSLAFSENVGKRFEGYGWQVLNINDVNDIEQIISAVKEGQSEKNKPTLIITKTHIGYGSPNKQDSHDAHGSPLGPDEIKLTKKNLGWDDDAQFFIPDSVKEIFAEVLAKGKESESSWNLKFNQYKNKYSVDAKLFEDMFNNNYGDEWKKHLPVFEDDGKKLATRQASSKTLNAIAKYLPALVGGSADLNPSTNTYLNGFESFSADNYKARNIHFGIREHGMGSILNGMSMYGGVIPYGATFLVFSDYCRPAFRLASISHIRNIYVFTHDSIGLGEDGPTHQPIEHFASLRAIPGLILIRPADANETAQAWKTAIEHQGSAVAIILTRQGLPIIDQNKYSSAENLSKGAYIISASDGEPDLILIASGSEVSLALQSAEKLRNEGIKTNVLSFPSWELFEKQSEEYKNLVLPKSVKARVVIEAGVKQGWEKYIGENGEAITIEKYGASAPGEILFKEYGFTVENVISKAKLTIENTKK